MSILCPIVFKHIKIPPTGSKLWPPVLKGLTAKETGVRNICLQSRGGKVRA